MHIYMLFFDRKASQLIDTYENFKRNTKSKSNTNSKYLLISCSSTSGDEISPSSVILVLDRMYKKQNLNFYFLYSESATSDCQILNISHKNLREIKFECTSKKNDRMPPSVHCPIIHCFILSFPVKVAPVQSINDTIWSSH